MLTLPIKKKWYDMILSGEKKEEYREIKPYYTERFNKKVMLFDHFLTKDEEDYLILPINYDKTDILFRNGYGNDKQTIKCKVRIACGTGRPEWGAEPNKKYYVLKILSVEEVK